MSEIAYIANEILNQLRTLGKRELMSWGANHFVAGKSSLTFNVQGFKLTGKVTITLNSMDLYDIEFFNEQDEKVSEKNGIFFDMMVGIIDNEVETTNGKYTEAQIKQIKAAGSSFWETDSL